MLDGACGPAGACGEADQIESRVVGERIGLEIGPEVFDRIELGCVGGQVLQMRRAGRSALGDELTQMRLEAIPDQHDRAAQLALQVLEKVHHAGGVDVGVGMQAEIQRHPVAAGADAHGGDGRNFLMRARALPEYRGVSAQAPGATHERRHQQAGFVEKNQCRSQARSVFFTLGQSCSIQAWMRSSSRSTARRVGFCGEKPKPCSRRLTCAEW